MQRRNKKMRLRKRKGGWKEKIGGGERGIKHGKKKKKKKYERKS